LASNTSTEGEYEALPQPQPQPQPQPEPQQQPRSLAQPQSQPEQQPSTVVLAEALLRLAAALENGTSGANAVDLPGAAAFAAAVTGAANAPSGVSLQQAVQQLSPPLAKASPTQDPAPHQATVGGKAGRASATSSVARRRSEVQQVPQTQLLTELDARVARIECGMGEGSGGKPEAQTADRSAALARELDALKARNSRLEQELTELRVQVARRLDASDREVAKSKQDAVEARTETASLRLELAELGLQLARLRTQKLDSWRHGGPIGDSTASPMASNRRDAASAGGVEACFPHRSAGGHSAGGASSDATGPLVAPDAACVRATVSAPLCTASPHVGPEVNDAIAQAPALVGRNEEATGTRSTLG